MIISHKYAIEDLVRYILPACAACLKVPLTVELVQYSEAAIYSHAAIDEAIMIYNGLVHSGQAYRIPDYQYRVR